MLELRAMLRSLNRSRGYVAAVVLTIALGIGVNTAVFSVIYRVILDPLPYRDPGRLMHVGETHPEFPAMPASAPDFFDWQRLSRSFSTLAAYTFQAAGQWRLEGDFEPEEVHVVQASASLFPMLGAEPLLGRWYTGDEERQKLPVVLIHEKLWRRKFHADPALVGRQIRLYNWSVTVVGIVPARVAQPAAADVWMGLGFLDPALTETRRFHVLEVVGRLAPGVSAEQAQSEMSALAAAIARDNPGTNARMGAMVMPLKSWMAGEARPALLIAWSSVGLILILACANIAHLVLVRTGGRSVEFAVREALGAGRARLARLIVIENLLLAAGGGLLGIVLAVGLMPWMPMAEGKLSPPAVGFAAVAVLACAAVVAVPSLFRMEVFERIKAGPRRFGAVMVALEVALAFAVLLGAGLLYRSYSTLMNEDAGFEAKGVTTVVWRSADPDWTKAQALFEQRVEPAVRALPGVEAVAGVNMAPFSLKHDETLRFATRFSVKGQPVSNGQFPVAQMRWSTAGYREALRIPLRTGRWLRATDAAEHNYVINEALARRYFPGRDPVGQKLLMNVLAPQPDEITIVGVVGDVRDLGLDLEPAPTLYSLGVANWAVVLVRGAVRGGELRAAIRAATPGAILSEAEALTASLERSVALRRLTLRLLGVFAGLAAALAVLGIYGVVRYSLSQRRREFAIRFALGAAPSEVYRLLGRGYGWAALAGLAAGGWLAQGGMRLLRTQLYRVSDHDPATAAGAVVTVLALIALAVWRPAAKAAAEPPMRALRE